mmetsp:Transcript_9133/g.26465  ORF Transcript_9133/g.26465 Transcript_9133/m.26465 type:complete len:341 (-) Transcript_9133:583-1605(-)
MTSSVCRFLYPATSTTEALEDSSNSSASSISVTVTAKHSTSPLARTVAFLYPTPGVFLSFRFSIAVRKANSPTISPPYLIHRTSSLLLFLLLLLSTAASTSNNASINTSHSPLFMKYILSPTSPLRIRTSPFLNLSILNAGCKIAAKGFVRTALSISSSVTSNFIEGDFVLGRPKGLLPSSVIHGCSIIPAIDMRFFGSITNIFRNISFNESDNFGGGGEGTIVALIMASAFSSGNFNSVLFAIATIWKTVFPVNGNRAVAMLYKHTPNDQTSLGIGSNPVSSNISGAKNAGVPAKRVDLVARVNSESTLTPKSHSFTPSAIFNMFSGFKSMCAISKECK